MSKAGNIDIRKQATISFAGNLADTAMSFLGLIAMAYVLGAADLGRYYLILSVVNVALFPVNGIAKAVLKRGSEESNDPSEVYSTGVVLSVLYCAAIAAVVFLIQGTDVPAQVSLSVLGLYSFEIPIQVGLSILLISVALFVSRAVLIVQIDAYSGYGHTGYATLVDNAYGILQTLLQLSVLALGFEIAGLLLATVIATVVTIVVHLLVSVVSLSRPSVSIARSIFEYGRWSIPSAGLSAVYNRLPVIFLGFLGLEAEIGYYQAADRLLMLGSYVGASLAPALMAKTSSRTSTGDADEMFGQFRESHHHVSLLAVALAFGSFALSEPLMLTMFDMANPLAAEALIILTFSHIVKSLARIEYSFLDGLDLPELNTKSTLISLLTQAVLLPVLYDLYGLPGVLLSIVVSQGVSLGIAQVIFWDRFRTIPLPGGLLPQGVSGVVMFASVRFLRDYIGVSSVFVLVPIVGFGAIVYFSTLLTIDNSFRTLARSLFRDFKREASARTGS